MSTVVSENGQWIEHVEARPADIPVEEQRPVAEVLTEELPICAAMTRKGQPCRNRALPGQPYCRVHAPAQDLPVVAAEDAAAPAPSDTGDLEVSIRQASAAPPPAPAEQEVPIRRTSTPPPPAPAEQEVPIRRATPFAEPPQAADLPPDTATSPASSVYEVEVEIRNHAQSNGLPGLTNIADFAANVLRLIGENLERMTPPQVRQVLDMLRDFNLRDYLDPDFWRGIGMVLEYQIKEQVAFVQRRLRGEFEVDPYGMDRELIELLRPFLVFMYRNWWRISSSGLDHVPDAGRGLLVANHSGVLPWDGAMIATAVAEEHPSARLVRNLYLNWFNTLPFVASTLASLGHVPGLPENAVHLLDDDELVCVFPEGAKGLGKLYKDRYHLARFGRGGFVQAALRTGAPLLPVAVIGAEEIYPMLANAEPLARLLRLPYFPITPFFPWLGPLGAIPLPTRWSITFCPPISTLEYGPDAADDPLIVFMLSEQVRCTIQETINAKLQERSSIF